MRSEWPELPLEECMDAIIDYRGKTPRKTESGIPLVTAKIIKDGRIEKPEEFIDPTDYEEWMRRGIPKAGDIVLTTEAPLGEVAQLDGSKVALAQRVITLRGKSGVVDNTFLKFLLLSKGVQEQLKGRSTGTTVHGIRQSELRKVLLPVPSITEQHAIAHILGTLDDKIELNRKMNETLETIAQAIFKKWFVDANADGLPKGWGVISLPEAVEVNPPRVLQKGKLAPYLDMKNMPTQGHRPLGWINRKFGSGMRFVNGDTLLARITPCLENGKTAFVDWLADGQVGWGSTEYIVLRPKSPLPPEYGYYLARSEELRAHAIQNMSGSSGRQRVQPECFKQFEISMPPEPLARGFGETAKQIVSLIRANDEQSRTLAALRDTLLPKLMAGEIKINENNL